MDMEGNFAIKPKYNQNQNKSFYLIKLTDFAQKLLEKCSQNEGSQLRISLKFSENQGVLKVLSSASNGINEKEIDLHFSIQNMAVPTEGAFECIKYKKGSLHSLGHVKQKFIINAKDDIYATTREKMAMAEEKSKQNRAKEIKMPKLVGKKSLLKSNSTLTNNLHRRLPSTSPMFERMKAPSSLPRGPPNLSNKILPTPSLKSTLPHTTPTGSVQLEGTRIKGVQSLPGINRNGSGIVGAPDVIRDHNRKPAPGSLASINSSTGTSAISARLKLHQHHSLSQPDLLVPDPRKKLAGAGIAPSLSGEVAGFSSSSVGSGTQVKPQSSLLKAVENGSATSFKPIPFTFPDNKRAAVPSSVVMEMAVVAVGAATSSLPHDPTNQAAPERLVGKMAVSPEERASLTLKEIVIHTLALRPYKRSELIQKLEKEHSGSINQALAEVPKNLQSPDDQPAPPASHQLAGILTGILNSVAVFNIKDSAYSLARHGFADIRSDWPLYNDNERAYVKRKMPTSSSPKPIDNAKTPPHLKQLRAALPATPSAVSTSGATPTAAIPKAQTGPSKQQVTDSHEPSSPRSVAHKRALPPTVCSKATNPKSDGASHRPKANDKPDTPETAFDGGKRLKVGAGSGPGDKDYLRNFSTITSRSQRQDYKDVFDGDYQEYLTLHKRLQAVWSKFCKMDSHLNTMAHDDPGYKESKARIMKEYKETVNSADSHYSPKRRRFDYLHAKLSHIKHLVASYDSKHHNGKAPTVLNEPRSYRNLGNDTNPNTSNPTSNANTNGRQILPALSQPS